MDVLKSGSGFKEALKALRSKFASSLKAQSLPFELMICNRSFTTYGQGR